MPLLVPVSLLCLMLVTAEGWLFQRAKREATQALAAYAQKKQERARLTQLTPALNHESEGVVAADLARATRLLADWRSVLPDDDLGRPTASAPLRSIDAFFELTGLIGQLRAKAEREQVEIRPDEKFGFSAHAHEGPAPGQIDEVQRQWRAIRFLVEMLLESHPRALLAIQRERPGSQFARDQQTGAADFFEWDRSCSLRQAGLIECEAYRLAFSGQTGTLREFLNRLGASMQPVVVRGVEVEPLVTENPGRGPGRAVVAAGPKLLVKPGFSRFVVTLEIARVAANLAPAP